MPRKKVDTTVETNEFLEASEEYVKAEEEKERWKGEAKALKKVMIEKRRALEDARGGKTSLESYSGEDS